MNSAELSKKIKISLINNLHLRVSKKRNFTDFFLLFLGSIQEN